MATPDEVEQASSELADVWEDEGSALVRYAIVRAFGNLGTTRAIPVAAQGLQDPDERVRAAAAITLGRMRALQETGALVDRLKRDPKPSVRAAAAEALGDLDDPDAPLRLKEVPALIARLDDEPEVSVAAHRSLQRLTLQLLPRERAAWQAWWKQWTASAPDRPSGG